MTSEDYTVWVVLPSTRLIVFADNLLPVDFRVARVGSTLLFH